MMRTLHCTMKLALSIFVSAILFTSCPAFGASAPDNDTDDTVLTVSTYCDIAQNDLDRAIRLHKDNNSLLLSASNEPLPPEQIVEIFNVMTANFRKAGELVWAAAVAADSLTVVSDEESARILAVQKQLFSFNRSMNYEFIVKMKPAIADLLKNAPPEEPVVEEPDECELSETAYNEAKNTENETCRDIVQVVKDSDCHRAMAATKEAYSIFRTTCGLGR